MTRTARRVMNDLLVDKDTLLAIVTEYSERIGVDRPHVVPQVEDPFISFLKLACNIRGAQAKVYVAEFTAIHVTTPEELARLPEESWPACVQRIDRTRIKVELRQRTSKRED